MRKIKLTIVLRDGTTVEITVTPPEQCCRGGPAPVAPGTEPI